MSDCIAFSNELITSRRALSLRQEVLVTRVVYFPVGKKPSEHQKVKFLDFQVLMAHDTHCNLLPDRYFKRPYPLLPTFWEFHQ